MRGADKLLLPVDGMPLLRRQVLCALATGMPVLVTLGPGQDARRDALKGLNVAVMTIPDASQGMSGSLRAAALWAAKAAGLLVLLPDMPLIDTPHLATLIAAFEKAPLRVHRAATPDLRPGHPVLVPGYLLPRWAALSGDEGARSVIASLEHDPILVPLPADVALLDLDTPEDWAKWRSLPPEVAKD